ncbi:MAG: hypothetical protein NTZ65_00450 [Candidatus Berkelbacteria bacterium]|nr:hypothetical protein [Candidatus Berkelbacteria bacterium]
MTNDEQLDSIFGGDWREMTDTQSGEVIEVVAATPRGRIGVSKSGLQNLRITVELADFSPPDLPGTGPDRWLPLPPNGRSPRFGKTTRIDQLTGVMNEAKNAIAARGSVTIAPHTTLSRWAYPVVNEFD